MMISRGRKERERELIMLSVQTLDMAVVYPCDVQFGRQASLRSRVSGTRFIMFLRKNRERAALKSK